MTQTASVRRWVETVPDPMVPIPFRVRERIQELPDTFTLQLEQLDGEGFTFNPGQFNMLYQFGVGETPISISGNPRDHSVISHTIRAVGTVTSSLRNLRPGQMVGVRGPFGKGWPLREAEGQDIILVAGGVGLAPLRPVIYHLLTHRAQYGRICIFYGARTHQDILYRQELEHWRGRFDMLVDVTVDRATPDWQGKVGVVTKLLNQRGFDPLDTVAFVCGPEIMMRYSVFSLNDQGVDNNRIYISMERNMKCAIGFCGHCQYGGSFICRDGPVFRFDTIAERFNIREL